MNNAVDAATMGRRVGRRVDRPLSLVASATLLVEGARFNDEIHRLPTGQTTCIAKGVFRYKTHQEANRHDLACLLNTIADACAERS